MTVIGGIVLGLWRIRTGPERIKWTLVTFPDSGCYQLVQTAGDRFVLRGLNGERAIHLSLRE